MPSTITVTLSGDSAPLAAALADAGAGFDSMAATADAATVDMGASMDALAASMVDLQASIDALAASFDSMAASSATATAGIDAAGASANTATAEALGLSDAVDTLTGAFDALMGSVMPVIETLGTLIAVMGAMVIIQDVTSWIENLVQQMFELDKQTQRVVNSWQYLFSQAAGGGVKAAQALASWAYQESPKLPFTAVDLRGGVSTLGTIPGIGPGEIEKFMPVLADIASTLGASDFGGQGITLQQAAQAIVGAQFGLTRQLRYELHINPQELLKYGLKGKATATGLRITDPSTLIPAIEKWSAARGLGGAAQEQETTTFWGAESSFMDYMQNILQTVGGIDPATGKARQGSMFQGLQNILINANSMLAQAQTGGQGPLGTLMGGAGNILGGGVKGIESLFGGIASGFGAAGGGDMVTGLLTKIKEFGEWLQSSSVQAEIKKLGEGIGQFAAEATKLAQVALPVMMAGLKDVAEQIQQFWASMSPMQRKALEGFVADIFLVIGAIAGLVAAVIGAAAAFNTGLNHIATTVEGWGKNLANQFKTWGANFIDMLIQGIESKLGDFGGLINKIGQEIANKLKFNSPPKEGPLADSDRWMPTMMTMFTTDIERGLPGVSHAAQQAAAAIAFPMHAGVHMAMGGGGANTTYHNATNYGGGSSMFNVYGATGVMVEEIVMKLLQQHDRTANLAMQQPGGMYLFGMH